MYSLNSYMLMNMISFMFMIILILLGVAFLTLMERKILGFIQLRKGPNKIGILGMLQPFSDAIKLLTKEIFFISKSNYYFYYFSPMLSILLSMFFWMVYPFFFNIQYYYYSMLLMFCLFSLGPYSLMLGGWSSNSNYAMLGSLRSIAQSISYEVSMILIILSMIFLLENFLMKNFFMFQMYMYFFFLIFPLFLMFFISILAELNRTPFDLIEGESELVSGFNVEYFSSMFVFYFLAEYMMIIFSSMILIIMFMAINLNSFMFLMMMMLLLFLIIWIRGILPRIRYDELMYLCWMKILPLSLIYLILIFSLKINMNIFE